MPADFAQFGSRDAIDKALQRMVRSGELRRIDRGLYDRPTLSKLTKRPTTPDYRAIVEAIARRDQLRLLVDGMTAANDLGLTDAVPARVTIHTDARRRAVKLDNLTIEFKPTAPSRLYWAGRPAMRVVQALHWMKDMLASDRKRILGQLAKLLADPAHGAAIDGLVAQIGGTYHLALGLPSDTADWVRAQGDAGFELLAEKVGRLLASSRVVTSALVGRYPIVVCDEHQDANAAQHGVVMRLHAAGAKVRIFADPMQSIYVRGAKARAEHAQRWRDLCGKADRVEELDFPHRWADSSPELGQWILRARLALQANQPIDVRTDRPAGLVVHLADNLAATRRGGVAFEAQGIRPVRKAITAAASVMILAGQNDTVLGVRAFLGRSVPIWEGHTRDGLPRLVTACAAGRGNPIAIAGAFTDFVQFVCKGFGDSAFADLFRAEVAAGAVKQRAGKPAQLQALARLILASPDHFGIARALELLVALKNNHLQFAEIEIDLRREFREAMQLAAFADPALGLIEITRRRTAVRSSMPSKFISTVHKAKGLEAEHVLLMPCDKAHFGDAEEKRCLLYVALSRARKSLTVVTATSMPSPWLICR